MNGQISSDAKKKPHRNWKLTGKAFYERNGKVLTHEAAPQQPLDDADVRRRIKYGY
jgi:hypothetical protein